MSWTTILLLAAGAYVFKALGVLIVGPATLRAGAAAPADASGDAPEATAGGSTSTTDNVWLRLGQLLPPALLAALVVSQTIVTGTSLVIDARLAGVAAGAVGVWRGAPFWLVLVIAATTTALLRLVAG
jgi:hypothetical protein